MGFTIISRDYNELVIEIDGVIHTSLYRNESSRTVYIFDNFVVKFSEDEWCNQNETELNVWHKMQEEDKPHFASIIDYEYTEEYGLVLRQERIIGSDDGVTDELVELFIKLSDTYNLGDIAVSEGYVFNCLVTNAGALKIYDFGR